MDNYWSHKTIYANSESEQYLFTFSIPKVNSISDLYVSTSYYTLKNGCKYSATLKISENNFTFFVYCISSTNIKCYVSMSIKTGNLFSNTLKEPTSHNGQTTQYYNLVKLSLEDACFQKLKQYPNGILTLICRIKYPVNPPHSSSSKSSFGSKTNGLYNLKTLADALNYSSELLSKEKVILRVAENSISVSKAILCARSPVFARMFQNDMKELKEKIVEVTDIKMHVLEALVSYLYTGNLPSFEFDFMCDLYYAADKYDVADVRQLCIDFLLPNISTTNVWRVLKLALTHNDEQLKYAAMTTIMANIETIVKTIEWKYLITEEPEIANEVLNFIDF